MLAVVSCDVKQPIVRACPKRSLVDRRLRQSEHRVVVFDGGDVICQGAAAWLLFGFVVQCEIATDLCPALTVVGRFENAFRRSVEDIRVMWRKHQRRDPLKTMGEIDGAVTGIIEWHW